MITTVFETLRAMNVFMLAAVLAFLFLAMEYAAQIPLYSIGWNGRLASVSWNG